MRHCPGGIDGVITMLDVIFIALGVGFFLGCVAYTYACDRL